MTTFLAHTDLIHLITMMIKAFHNILYGVPSLFVVVFNL